MVGGAAMAQRRFDLGISCAAAAGGDKGLLL